MDLLTELHDRMDAAMALLPSDVASVTGLGDDQLEQFLRTLSRARTTLDRAATIAAGVIASRSRREDGHAGLAASRGHRSPVAMVQQLAGGSRAEAAKQVRLGQSLLEAPPAPTPAVTTPQPARPWHAPLDDALLSDALTTTQTDAIMRGLGAPPDAGGEAWRLAAEQLVAEAGALTVEDLGAAARAVRDTLDPAGAEARYLARFETRSFRMWKDADGIEHARLQFDDDGAAWVRTIIASTLRARRGGPRFVDADEAERAKLLVDDPRTGTQLEYDVLMAALRAGAVAEPEKVFGTRQAGVRVVITREALAAGRDALGRPLATGHLEDGGDALPAAAVCQALCDTGVVPVTVDACGNPLDVGREQRLFTPRQRIALAVRDGGCLWPGCSMPASYCEAHHADEWTADRGRTDIDRGLLLCRFHHLNLHHRGYRIRRDGTGPFLLQPPGGPPTELRSRSPLRRAWHPPPGQSSRPRPFST